ncbi:hypothetical protein [Mucilaginibacter panaciglaebae]|uniref:NigD-like protein n=1 Tax=Mucilaginibacter panaciglaebae TaxID=502331 RepID=A0ABP7WNA4_9SPHI
MKYKIGLTSLLLIIMSLMLGCIGDSNKLKHDTTIVHYEMKQGRSLASKDWHCYDVDEERVCIPTNWKMRQQSKYLFMSDVDAFDQSTFFVVLKYNKVSSGLDVTKYLKTTYHSLKNDTVEVFTGYTVKKITFEDKESVYGEYYTSIKHKPYMTYSTVFEKDNDLFEIALKVDSTKAVGYKEIYRDILFNIQHKGKAVFSAKDVIKDIQVIDISKL